MRIFRGALGGRDSFGGRLLIARLLQGPLVADGIPPSVLIDALQAERTDRMHLSNPWNDGKACGWNERAPGEERLPLEAWGCNPHPGNPFAVGKVQRFPRRQRMGRNRDSEVNGRQGRASHGGIASLGKLVHSARNLFNHGHLSWSLSFNQRKEPNMNLYQAPWCL